MFCLVARGHTIDSGTIDTFNGVRAQIEQRRGGTRSLSRTFVLFRFADSKFRQVLSSFSLEHRRIWIISSILSSQQCHLVWIAIQFVCSFFICDVNNCLLFRLLSAFSVADFRF